MGVQLDKDRNIIYVTKQQCIEESVKQFNKYGISAFRTPMDNRAQYSKSKKPEAGSVDALQVATLKYHELIGTLLLISDGPRPDIVFAVNTLARFTCNTTDT
jgi:hypothetical protein